MFSAKYNTHFPHLFFPTLRDFKRILPSTDVKSENTEKLFIAFSFVIIISLSFNIFIISCAKCISWTHYYNLIDTYIRLVKSNVPQDNRRYIPCLGCCLYYCPCYSNF